MNTGECSQPLMQGQSVLNASPGLLYTESMLFPLRWFLSLLTSTKPLYGPSSFARLAYALFPAPDLCLLGPSCCGSTGREFLPALDSLLGYLKKAALCISQYQLPGCFWACDEASDHLLSVRKGGSQRVSEARGKKFEL